MPGVFTEILEGVLTIYSSWDIKKLADASAGNIGGLDSSEFLKGIACCAGTMVGSEYI